MENAKIEPLAAPDMSGPAAHLAEIARFRAEMDVLFDCRGDAEPLDRLYRLTAEALTPPISSEEEAAWILGHACITTVTEDGVVRRWVDPYER